MEQKNMKITVDSITRNGTTKQITVKGWAFAEAKTPEIQVVSLLDADIEIKQFYRMDVNVLFELPNNVNTGFEIIIQPKNDNKKVEFEFTSGVVKQKYIVKLNKHYPIEVGTETPFQLKISKVKKGLHYLRKNGLSSAIKRYQLEKTVGGNEYRAWIAYNEKINVEEIKEKINQFKIKPLISIVIPVYNVEVKWLAKCIESVQQQIYTNWELCICDDASTNPEISKLLNRYMEKDTRIKCFYRESNGHISQATNDAIRLATGSYLAFLDNDDTLATNALYEVVERLQDYPETKLIYSDEDKITTEDVRFEPAFKPDWSPDLLMGTNYISHLCVIEKELVDHTGGLRVGYEGAQDYDLILRCVEQLSANEIQHISKVLYHWRTLNTSTAQNPKAKQYANEIGIKVLQETLRRRNILGTVKPSRASGFYSIFYTALEKEKVSVIIPTRNGYDDVKTCIDSIIEKTTYPNYEIILADNQSDDPKMIELYKMYQKKLGTRFTVEHIDIPFNYSKINNIAASKSNGKYLLFLNNDTKVINPDWMSYMVGYAQFDRIGCVGAKLYYPDNTIQHAGVIMGLGDVAGHGHHYFPGNDIGYFGHLILDVNYLAVTAACVLMKKNDFDAVGGFDEEFTVAFNDVDLCMKIYELGRYNVWAHNAELYHYESKSRGYENTPEKLQRFDKEKLLLQTKWHSYIDYDPFYSPNLTRGTGNFTIKVENIH